MIGAPKLRQTTKQSIKQIIEHEIYNAADNGLFKVSISTNFLNICPDFKNELESLFFKFHVNSEHPELTEISWE